MPTGDMWGPGVPGQTPGYREYGYVTPVAGKPRQRRLPWRAVAWSIAITVMVFCLVTCGALVAGVIMGAHQAQQQERCLAHLPWNQDPARCLSP